MMRLSVSVDMRFKDRRTPLGEAFTINQSARPTEFVVPAPSGPQVF
jgi:hypothetical protein